MTGRAIDDVVNASAGAVVTALAGTAVAVRDMSVDVDARPALVTALLDEQLARTPDAPALEDGLVRWSYRDLFARADDVAARLRARGIGPGDLVGVAHRRRAGAVAALLGVLRAGAAYVPLDPTLPDQRIAEMIGRARLGVVVADTPNHDRIAGLGPVDVLVPADGPVAPRSAVPASATPVLAADPAYVLFTSGTSGAPKGVTVSHGNLSWFLAWLRRELDHRDFAVVAATMSFGFDPSIIELFGPLTTGGRVHLLDSPMDLTDLSAPVTLVAAVPSIAVEVARSRRLPRTLRTLIMGGQELTAETARALRAAAPTVRLLNTYGPTETTVMVTSHEITGSPGARVPIGEPVPGSYVVVLDDDGAVVAPGEPGELHIGGHQVGQCYLGEPALTAERFVEVEHPGYGRHRLYRSGDRVVQTPEGLVFLGRVDDQVKVRGFRVEPTEIELHLRRVPGVAAAVVQAVTRNGDQQLVAYHVPTDPARPVAADDLRAALAEVLPPFAVPAGFVVLDTVPLTANGKLDVAALPPWPARTGRVHGGTDPVESQVVDAVRHVLGTNDAVLPDDDVVEHLGASSLALVRVLAHLEAALGVRLPVGRVVRDTTVRGIAAVVRLGLDGAPARNEPAVWRAQGSGAPVVLFHTYLGGVLRYRRLLATVPDEHPLIGIQALDLDPLPAEVDDVTLESVADQALDQLLAVRPHGPYVVGGHSIGGLIAVEVAQRLRDRGEAVEQVVLVDTLPRRGLVQYAWAELLLNLPDLLAATGAERWARVRAAIVARLPRWRTGRTGNGSASRDRIDGILDGAGHTSNRAVRRYRSGRYDGDVVLLRTFHGITMAAGDPTLGWGRLVGGQLTIRDVPGQHGTILDPDLIDAVGDRLRETLGATTPPSTPPTTETGP